MAIAFKSTQLLWTSVVQTNPCRCWWSCNLTLIVCFALTPFFVFFKCSRHAGNLMMFHGYPRGSRMRSHAHWGDWVFAPGPKSKIHNANWLSQQDFGKQQACRSVTPAGWSHDRIISYWQVSQFSSAVERLWPISLDFDGGPFGDPYFALPIPGIRLQPIYLPWKTTSRVDLFGPPWQWIPTFKNR